MYVIVSKSERAAERAIVTEVPWLGGSQRVHTPLNAAQYSSTHHAVLSVLYIAVYDHDVIRSAVYTQSHSIHTRTTALFYIHIIHLLTISMITSDVEILLGVTDRRRTDRTQWDVPYWQMSPAYGTSHVQSNVSRA